MNTVSSRFILK
ncbi:hypothetical protein CP061683_1024A, partial [Chlamydia psittaci 06-1683]